MCASSEGSVETHLSLPGSLRDKYHIWAGSNNVPKRCRWSDNSVDPDQHALSLHCLPRPICHIDQASLHPRCLPKPLHPHCHTHPQCRPWSNWSASILFAQTYLSHTVKTLIRLVCINTVCSDLSVTHSEDSDQTVLHQYCLPRAMLHTV